MLNLLFALSNIHRALKLCSGLAICNSRLLAKFMSALGALRKIDYHRYRWAWLRQIAVPNRGLAIFLTLVAIVFGVVLPARADERPTDPFGNHTTELNKDAPLVLIWDSLRDRMQLEKAYFHDCTVFKGPPCPSTATLVQKLDEIRQYRGKALLGHLNVSVNLMIKPAPSEWLAPLEAITMKNGDCKAYSLAKYAGAQELGIPADHVRLVIVHNRRHAEDHMVAAVYQDGEWFILDNLTNLLLRDWEKTDYEPLAVSDYRGARRYLAAFWSE
jgi:predicted transglutaminase-like cysteine proteinase